MDAILFHDMAYLERYLIFIFFINIILLNGKWAFNAFKVMLMIEFNVDLA